MFLLLWLDRRQPADFRSLQTAGFDQPVRTLGSTYINLNIQKQQHARNAVYCLGEASLNTEILMA